MSYNRADRLYILASVCKNNNVTPDSPSYMGLIIKVCTSKLSLSIDVAKEYAADLAAAYRADQWATIAPPQTIEAETSSSSTQQVIHNTPTLNQLKTFNLKGPCTPIKTITPQATIEPEDTPHNQALILLNLAQHDQFNGAGRITLSQARYELNNKSLQIEDVLRLLRQELETIEFEHKPGNYIYFYFDGKNSVKQHRQANPVIPRLPPVMPASANEYYNEPPLEKAYFKGKRVTY